MVWRMDNNFWEETPNMIRHTPSSKHIYSERGDGAHHRQTLQLDYNTIQTHTNTNCQLRRLQSMNWRLKPQIQQIIAVLRNLNFCYTTTNNCRPTQIAKHDLTIQDNNSVRRCCLLFVYNMNFCLYRQPTSWHGGWLQLHRLQCMNWKLKTQIQSKLLIHYTDCKAWPEDSRYKFSQKVPLSFVYNMKFFACTGSQQVGMALGYSCMGRKAWAEDGRHKFNQKLLTSCYTIYNCHHPNTGCKALAEDSRYKFSQKLLLAFD